MRINEKSTVLVLGSGVSGLMNIQLANLKGARVIATDINEYRLNKAREFGADEAVNMSEQNLDVKADKILICTGAMQAFEQAFRFIDKKGVIMFFAVPQKNISLPSVDFWRNEITATSSYGAAPVDLQESLELIRDGKINVKGMITHRFSMDNIQEAFGVAAQAGESLKVVIVPGLNNASSH